jgi:hypothetical protein
MAFCTKCGNQLAEDARFCTACGAEVGAAPVQPIATPSAKKRSPLVWIVPVVIVGLIVLGVAGWFGLGLITGGTPASRARAQAETVADFMQGYYERDVAKVRRTLPAEFADEIAEAMSTEEVDASGSVSREWDGDALVLTYTSDSGEDVASGDTMRLTADGGKERGVVTLEQGGTDGYTYEAVVAREGGRWVLVEIDGTPVAEAWGFEDSDDSSDDSSTDNGGSVGVGADQCWESQSEIEMAASNYYFDASENQYTDISGEVNDDNWLVTDGWLDGAPTCPYDGEYYYLFDDGTTGCPSGVHGYYLDEE